MKAAPAPSTWLPRLFFCLTLGSAAVLLLLVVVSPWLREEATLPADWTQVIDLFAQDATLRRTTVASALGLAVTACIFFRPASVPQPEGRKSRTPKRPPPPNVAGA